MIPKDSIDDPVFLRSEICRVGHSLFTRGYVHASAGNISVRLPSTQGDGFLITPTDACLGFLEPERIAQIDVGGQQTRGDPASKTLALHRRIYQADPTARCIIHTHSTHLVALSLQGVWQVKAILPPITPYFVMKVGRVPLIPYYRPGDPRAATYVAETISEVQRQGGALRAVMLDRLGPVVWGRDLAGTMAALEELEETARLWLLCHPKPEPLDAARLAELQQTFGAIGLPKESISQQRPSHRNGSDENQ